MIKAILFDFDGTVVDSLKHITPSWQAAFAEQGITLSHEEVVQNAFYTTKEEKIAKYGIDPERLHDNFRKNISSKHSEYEMHEGVDVLLRKLKELKIKTAIVSMTNSARIREVLTLLQLADLFYVVLGGGDTERKKPHPDIAFKAMELLGVESGDAILVGDSYVDIETGNNAGVRTGLFISDKNLPYIDKTRVDTATPTFTFSSYPELLTKIDELPVFEV